MRRLKLTSYIACLIGMLAPCQADEINLDDIFARKMAAKLGIKLDPVSIKWFSFSNFRIIPKETIYQTIKESALPESVLKKTFIYPNCTEQPFIQTKKETIQYALTTTVSVKTQITANSSSSSNWSLSLKNPVFKEGFSGSEKDGISLDLSKSDTTSSRRTITEDIGGNIEQKPRTITVIIYQKKLRTDYVDFDGIVLVDGIAQTYGIANCGPDGRCVQPIPINLRDVLSEEERTVELKGSIWNVSAEDTKTSYHTFDTADHPEYCPSLEQLLK